MKTGYIPKMVQIFQQINSTKLGKNALLIKTLKG